MPHALRSRPSRRRLVVLPPRRLLALVVALLPALGLALGLAPNAGAEGWPQFRGDGARGLADAEIPTAWSVPDDHNIAWRVDVPGLGHSSPVVWLDDDGGTVFLTSAVRQGEGEDELKVGLYGDIAPVDDDSPHRWLVLAYDLETGAERWRRVATSGVPTIQRHTKSTHANSTPAVDGERVIALFGSEGLFAYSHDGELLWSKDLGTLDSGFLSDPTAQWGFGASPVVHDGLVVVQADVQKGSFLAAFDATDGRLVWKTQRDEVPTWSTPTVIPADVTGAEAGAQVVVNGFKRRGAYALSTGEPVWWQEGGGDIPIPTPFEARGLLLFTSAHGGMAPLVAIRADARGVLPPLEESAGDDAAGDDTAGDASAVAWSHPRGGSYMPTPIAVGDLLYRIRDNGVLSTFEIATGEKVYDARLGGGSRAFTASPVAAGDHVYFTSETGEIFVVRHGREHELVATNPLDAVTLASPAIAADTLLFRTRGQLVAVRTEQPASPTTKGSDEPSVEPTTPAAEAADDDAEASSR